MGSGPGRIQRTIIEIFATDPAARLTVAQMAERAYPGETITRSHTNAVGLALRNVAPMLGLTRVRVSASGRFGWRHVWGRK